MGEYDLERALIERAESREAFKRTVRTISKSVFFISLFVAYVIAARTWPDLMIGITMSAFGIMLVSGIVYYTYNSHLSDVRNNTNDRH